MTVTTSGSTREGSENHLEGKGNWISAMPLDALGLAIVYIKNVNQTNKSNSIKALSYCLTSPVWITYMGYWPSVKSR